VAERAGVLKIEYMEYGTRKTGGGAGVKIRGAIGGRRGKERLKG